MVTTTAIKVETLASIDAAAAPMLEALVIASGWNQTARDWQLFERLGTIHVVRDDAGAIVASGAVLPMARAGTLGSPHAVGPDAAWISMILVAPAVRGLGLGRAVFARCLQQVNDAGRVAMLDATPQGEALYAQFGFAPLWRLTRWQRGAQQVPLAGALAAADKPAIDSIAALDAQALGIARPAVLAELLGREDSGCVRSGLGFAIVRAGRVARQIGPMLATDERTAAGLLVRAAGESAEPLYIDVPDGRPLFAQALSTAGFTPQRGYARMAQLVRGDHGADRAAPPLGQPAFIHAIAGPEFG
jgi:GNAT superfamily N-acetyltransferase